MNEREELQQLNISLKEGLMKVNISIDKLNGALLGDEYNKDGVIHRLEKIETKIKRLDKAFYIMLGAVTLGAYPVGLRISEIIKPILNTYIK